MEILVCIKQVADDSVEIFMNESTGRPALERIKKVVNAFDTYALEMAARLKEAKGDTAISVLSLGGEDVTNSLKNCLAVGADEAFCVKDGNYQEKDAVIVAQTLKIRKRLVNHIIKIKTLRQVKKDLQEITVKDRITSL